MSQPRAEVNFGALLSLGVDFDTARRLLANSLQAGNDGRPVIPAQELADQFIKLERKDDE
jgi:hypothetical protein